MRPQHWLALLSLLAAANGVSDSQPVGERHPRTSTPVGPTRRIKVQHLAPYVGRHAGGLLINVTGRGFVISTNPKCRFGAMEVVATVRSQTLMQCYTPVNTDFNPQTPYAAQIKALEVSLNGVDWTVSKRSFTFYDHARVIVSLFEPQGGPSQGGTHLYVHGSHFRSSEHLRCTWDGNNDPALKVEATYIDFNTLKCITPPIPNAGADLGVSSMAVNRALEIALDDYHFTSINRQWTTYDDRFLIVSAVDPIGGPVRGGTLIEVLGEGFQRLGGAVQHAPTLCQAEVAANIPCEKDATFPPDHPEAYRRVNAGTFCKFSFDAVRSPRGQDPWCAQSPERNYDGLFDRSPYPAEGAVALARSTSNRHQRNHTCFTESTTPSLGRLSSVVQATFVNENLMLCRTPPFAGVLRDNHALLRVHVTLNGDFHDLRALSNSNATYAVYDPREARIHSMLRTGGPLNGSTFIFIYGKLFYDFTLRSLPDRSHLLQCRFGFAGQTPATWHDAQRVACYSPRIYGVGHRQSIEVDITYNGQDFIEGPKPTFIYSPRDAYSIDGECRNEYGKEIGGSCLNNFTGVAVSELQPFGGPHNGGTEIIVMGRLFMVQGPSILCKFGNLTMNRATYLNTTAVKCISPPNPYVRDGFGFEDHYVEVTLNGEPNFLTDSRVPFVYYNHNTTLAVSAIYPMAGPKLGGNTITVYGSGFRVLGGDLIRTCDGVNMSTPSSEGMSSEELYGEYRTEGSLSRATRKGVGDSRVCSTPILEGTNRGLQCLFGSLPAVHAYLIRVEGREPLTPLDPDHEEEDDREGTALVCELPALPADVPLLHTPHVPGDTDRQHPPRALLAGTPYSVCVEITLNGNRSQATTNCVEMTYYDV